MLMRKQENFSGCRVLSYCVMSNHFHLLLEVPPMAVGGISDDELLKRLAALYPEIFVAEVAKELAEARAEIDEKRRDAWVAGIHGRFTHRMHDLSEFMKTLLQRFTRWFNRLHERTGTLWEERFKSVIVESGTAARTISAYIDLNPLRAGMVADPADYRWSSYGEAIGGGPQGDGKKAREGLMRAIRSEGATESEPPCWNEISQSYRETMGLGDPLHTFPRLDSEGVLHRRLRYFADGAVIGSQQFVDQAHLAARSRFGSKRDCGARKLKGNASPLNELLWSARDLQKGV
jgi:putative transposase